MIVFYLIQLTDSLYRFIYSGLRLAVVTSRPSESCSAVAGACCPLKIRALGVISVRGQHIKLISTCKSEKQSSKHLLFQPINLPRSAVMNAIAHRSKWNDLMLIKKVNQLNRQDEIGLNWVDSSRSITPSYTKTNMIH